MARKQERVEQCSGVGEFVEIASAFGRNVSSYYYVPSDERIDLTNLLTEIRTKLWSVLYLNLRRLKALKFNLFVDSTYHKSDTEELQDRAFKCKNLILMRRGDIAKEIDSAYDSILTEEANYQGVSSGWSLYSMDGVLLRLSKFTPLRGNSFIKTPEWIKRKKAIINCQNTDKYCFKYAILSKFVKNRPERVRKRAYEMVATKFDFTGLVFPVQVKDIAIFEKRNVYVSVNVYYIEKTRVCPLRITKEEKGDHFDLLLLQEGQNNHYCLITNLSRLLSSQLSKEHGSTEICRRCLTFFKGKRAWEKMEEHRGRCNEQQVQKVVMPKLTDSGELPVTKFKNFHHQFRLPIVLYADFESVLEPVHGCRPKDSSSYVVNIQKHKPFSFCVLIVLDNDVCQEIKSEFSTEPYLYRGDGAAEKFMKYVCGVANKLGDLVWKYEKIIFTEEDRRNFESKTHCEMCNVFIRGEIVKAHRDHCHITGKYRSALCFQCNTKRQNQKFLPIFLHNNSNYDGHFIVKELGLDERDIKVIPNSEEKYISFSKKTENGITLRFLDSYRFLADSLANLAKNLPREKFIQTARHFGLDKLDLVTKKSFFPYEYLDNEEKLEDPCLPPIEKFYSALTDEGIKEEDYQHAQNVWNVFGIKTLGEYSDVYLKIDVLLLTDIFESFRGLCIEYYNLDAGHYLTLPSFGWDAMLKYTGIELELMTDYDMVLMIMDGIRGGLSVCTKRFAEANNKYLPETFDCNKESTFITAFDLNNQYGHALANLQPYKGFRWLGSEEIEELNVMEIADDSPYGFILEVDLSYPESLHDVHNCFPFFPENKKPPGSKQKKLLSTLESKKNYVVHYSFLKLGLKHGIVLDKIHRAICFEQARWMKPYIDLNTNYRKLATNDFERDFWKLLNNSVFGKSIEDKKKRINFELVSNKKKMLKMVSKPNFEDRIIYRENLCAVKFKKKTVLLDKPIYIGFTVLELAKKLIFQFHYEIMKPYYKHNVRLLYTDTDSLFYEITTDDIFEDLRDERLREHFDFSNYPRDHFLFDESRKKHVGLMKDEGGGRIIKRFVGLRAKLYCYEYKGDEIVKKAKGIKKNVLKRKIEVEDYIHTLKTDIGRAEDREKEEAKRRRKMILFRSTKHDITTVETNKIALSREDDKRLVAENGIDTWAFGHYYVNEG
jgi:hypothetical protein